MPHPTIDSCSSPGHIKAVRVEQACTLMLTASWCVVMLATVFTVTPAWALYKVVGPDGKVTYTDRPPADQPSQTLKSNGSSVDTSSLPFALRQVVGKYPVTLYVFKDCAPCDQGRNLLQRRGVPYAEKSVDTAEDNAALERLEGSQQLPVLRIGQQKIQGYAQSEWTSYLDAAGYPKESALPRGYIWPKATPLVEAAARNGQAGASAAAPGNANRRNRAPGTTGTTPSDGTPTAPPGFRF